MNVSKCIAHMYVALVLIVPSSVACLAQETTSPASPRLQSSSQLGLPDAPNAVVSPNGVCCERLQTSGYSWPAPRERKMAFLHDLLGPGAFLGPAVQAAVDQAQPLKVAYPADGFTQPGEHPAHGMVPEWGEGFGGYEKRYASRFGMNLVSVSSRYGLAEVLREDVTYHRCTCSGLGRRAGHALAMSLLAHTSSGRLIPSLPAIVSPYVGSQVAVSAWFPDRFNASDAFRMSRSLYIGLPVRNLISEFTKY